MEKWEKEWLRYDEEKEDEELAKIVKSQTKKIVTSEFYSENFDPSICRYCMNYDWENDTCKVDSPYDYMAKDRGDCETWDYVFKTEDE